MTKSILISEVSRQVLNSLAVESGKSLQEVLDLAVEEYRRKVFLDAVSAGYGELRADPEAWAAHLEERKAWDSTLMDGVDSKAV
jgi:hypothetical protein